LCVPQTRPCGHGDHPCCWASPFSRHPWNVWGLLSELSFKGKKVIGTSLKRCQQLDQCFLAEPLAVSELCLTGPMEHQDLEDLAALSEHSLTLSQLHAPVWFLERSRKGEMQGFSKECSRTCLCWDPQPQGKTKRRN
jgi:hypothetical protein